MSLVVISIYCTSQLCPPTDEICFLFQTIYCTCSIFVHKFQHTVLSLQQMPEACDTFSQMCLHNKLPTT